MCNTYQNEILQTKIDLFIVFAVTARVIKTCGPVAQWIRHLTTNQGIPGSSPGGVDYFCLSFTSNI